MEKTMKERMATLEEKSDHIELSLDKIDKKLDEHLKNLSQNHIDFTEMADARYASKIVEKVVYSVVGVILTYFMAALTKLVGWW